MFKLGICGRSGSDGGSTSVFTPITIKFDVSSIIIFQKASASRIIFCEDGAVRCTETYSKKRMCVVYSGPGCRYPCAELHCTRNVFYDEMCPVYHCRANPGPDRPHHHTSFLYGLGGGAAACASAGVIFYLVAMLRRQYRRAYSRARRHSRRSSADENSSILRGRRHGSILRASAARSVSVTDAHGEGAVTISPPLLDQEIEEDVSRARKEVEEEEALCAQRGEGSRASVGPGPESIELVEISLA